MNSISVEGYNGAIAGAYPSAGPGIPSVALFVFNPDDGSNVKVNLSPVNAMALASSLAGAAEYVLPASELRDAEEEAYLEELD